MVPHPGAPAGALTTLSPSGDPLWSEGTTDERYGEMPSVFVL